MAQTKEETTKVSKTKVAVSAIANKALAFARKGKFAHLVLKERPTVTLCGYDVAPDAVLTIPVTPKRRQQLRDMELTGWGYTGELAFGFNGCCLRCDARADARPMAKTRGDEIAAELKAKGAEPRVKARQPKAEVKPTTNGRKTKVEAKTGAAKKPTVKATTGNGSGNGKSPKVTSRTKPAPKVEVKEEAPASSFDTTEEQVVETADVS